MNELIAKFKAIIEEGQQKISQLNESLVKLGKDKDELNAAVKDFELKKADIEKREEAVAFVENVLSLKSELAKRESLIAAREVESKKQIERREQALSAQESKSKEVEKNLAAQQVDIVEQRKKLEEEKKNFKEKVLKELAKNA